MKAVIQRVKSASITVDGNIISRIGQGLCVLIGISRDDTQADSDYISNKILKICLFDNAESGKRWSTNVMQRNFEILCVSQFTLYSTLKGNKPDFHLSMEAGHSKAIYLSLLDQMKKAYSAEKIFDGQFGALMEVMIVNDGPVTINLESPVQKLRKEIEEKKKSSPIKTNEET